MLLRFVNFVLVVGGVVDLFLQELTHFRATGAWAGALSALLVIRFEVVCNDPMVQRTPLGGGEERHSLGFLRRWWIQLILSSKLRFLGNHPICM